MRRASLLLAMSSACLGSAFDELSHQAWTTSTPRPDGVTSRDYGALVTSVDRELPGATILVVGSDPPSLTTLGYDETGGWTQRGLDLPGVVAPEGLIVTGALDPIPGGDGVFAVGGMTSPEGVALFDARSGAQGPLERRVLAGPDCGTGAAHALVFGVTNAGAALDLVALVGTDLVLFEDVALGAAPTCRRCTIAAPRRGLELVVADVDGREGDEILLTVEGWAGDAAALVVLDPAGLTGGECFALPPVVAPIVAPGGESDFGRRMAIGDADDDGVPDLALSAESAGRVYVARNLGATMTSIPSPAAAVRFGAAMAFGDFDGDDKEELAVGDPEAGAEGVAGAGRVTVYALRDGVFEPVATLHDSHPDPGQAFGRALVSAEFVSGAERADVLIVGALGEVFTYFRVLAAAEDPRLR